MYSIMEIGVAESLAPFRVDDLTPDYFVRFDNNTVCRDCIPLCYGGYEVNVHCVLETVDKEIDQCAENSSYFCDGDVLRLIGIAQYFGVNRFLVLVDMDWQAVDETGTVYVALMGSVSPEQLALVRGYLKENWK